MAAENLVGNLPNKVAGDYQRPLPRDFEDGDTGSMMWKNEKDAFGYDQTVFPAGIFTSFDTSITSPSGGDIYIGNGDTTTVSSEWDSAGRYDWVRYTADTSSWNNVTPQEGVLCYDSSANVWYTYDTSTTGWLPQEQLISTTKKYVALLTQSGASAPTATVLENTLGTTLTWSRQAVGNYRGTLGSGTFDWDKTHCVISQGSQAPYATLTAGEGGSNYIDVWTGDASATPHLDNDDLLNKTSLEIKVYE